MEGMKVESSLLICWWVCILCERILVWDVALPIASQGDGKEKCHMRIQRACICILLQCGCREDSPFTPYRSVWRRAGGCKGADEMFEGADSEVLGRGFNYMRVRMSLKKFYPFLSQLE